MRINNRLLIGIMENMFDLSENCSLDVVPDELMDLAQKVINSNENEDLSINSNKAVITRKRKKQRARSIAVRTLFVSGLPFDATSREIYLLFMRFKGFQASILKQARKDGLKYSPVAFVMFRKREQAELSRQEIDGVRFDPNSSDTLIAEFAKANTKTSVQKKKKVVTMQELDTNTKELIHTPELPYYQQSMAVTPSPSDITANIIYNTSEEIWVHQQLSPPITNQNTHPHLVQLPPQMPPPPNFAMVPLPPPPIVIATPFLPPPINLNHVSVSNCGQVHSENNENQNKCTLFVANMGMDTSEEELKAVFAKVPTYKRLKMLRNKDRTPVAFVEYEDHLSACQAKNLFQGKTLFTSSEGSGIRIEFAKKPMSDANYKMNHG